MQLELCSAPAAQPLVPSETCAMLTGALAMIVLLVIGASRSLLIG